MANALAEVVCKFFEKEKHSSIQDLYVVDIDPTIVQQVKTAFCGQRYLQQVPYSGAKHAMSGNRSDVYRRSSTSLTRSASLSSYADLQRSARRASRPASMMNRLDAFYD